MSPPFLWDAAFCRLAHNLRFARKTLRFAAPLDMYFVSVANLIGGITMVLGSSTSDPRLRVNSRIIREEGLYAYRGIRIRLSRNGHFRMSG